MAGFLKNLLDPSVALPMAGALMGGQGNQQNFANALSAMGPALQQNKTMGFLKQNYPELAAQVEAGLPVGEAFRMMSEERRLKAQAPKAPDVQTFFDDQGREYKAQWDGAGWQPVGGPKASRDGGLEVTLADGTTVRQGTFGSQDGKNVANRITTEQDMAKGSSDLKATVAQLRKANENTGYSGVGGSIYGAVDDTLEQFGVPSLPGNARARATMKSGGLSVALGKVQQTKGAISNAEMDLFMAASPGLQNTPEGNAAILDMADAVADRQIMRTQEMETWRQQRGTLDGFEAAWGEYINANPIIVPTEDGSARLATGGAPAAPVAPGGAQPPKRLRFNPQTGRLE